MQRILARLQRYDELSWLTYDRAEFLANIALFVPVGVFLLLLVGTRFWWLAGFGAFLMTSRSRPRSARSPAGCPTSATYSRTRSVP